VNDRTLSLLVTAAAVAFAAYVAIRLAPYVLP
jgi:hypothetical protein